MTKKFTSYIFLSLICLLTSGLASCSDEILGGVTGDGEMREYKGTISLNLSTPDLTLRSRTVNSEPGASILINNLWVGVFNTTTGECFGAKKYDNFNQMLTSGSIFHNLINVDFVAYDDKFPLAYIVAIANFDGVTTYDGRSLDSILPDFNERASVRWDDIINLDVDAATAYEGNKGENENSNAPFLAGFFQDASSLNQNPKIDQFSYDELGPSALYPEAAASGMDIELGDPNEGKIHVAAGALCLRRLVSHNKININLSNGFTVTELKYKRYNMPRTAYVLQRRTDTRRYSDFASWQKFSPNSADRHMTEGSYDYNDSFAYANDDDWIDVNIDAWEATSQVDFAFDHFENKHWGAGELHSQDDREARNPDGTFKALCSGERDAYNNFASYFVLKMHLVNKLTGENADVEYTLHEGFCNNEDGRRVNTVAEKCYDFSSFRNVNYTYNVNITGVNDITASVTAREGQETAHPNGQSGTIWKMDFVNSQSKSPVPIEGGLFDNSGRYITFSDKPDLGFRIIGRDKNGKLVDICYNMPDGMYHGFSGLWPEGNPVYIDKGGKIGSNSIGGYTVPENLLNDIKIGSGSTYHNIPDFIRGVEEGSINPADNYLLRIDNYDGNALGLKSNYSRGIYIFDRNDNRNASDIDGCSAYFTAYGAEQYPFPFEKLSFDKKNVMWDNTYYRAVSKLPYVFAATTPIFYGAECSSIDLRWKHDERFSGYRIKVFNNNYTHPEIVVPRSKLAQYLTEINGEQVFIYPLNTADFPRSSSNGALEYSFSIIPIVDPEMYEAGDPVTFNKNDNGDNSTCIRVCPPTWDFTSTNDWKSVNFYVDANFEAHYRGLSVLCPHRTVGSSYKNSIGKFICFGGVGDADSRCFSFVATVPGKFAVTVKSHTNAEDSARKLQIVRMDPNGSQTDAFGNTYDIVYDSKTMAGKNTVYTSDVLYPIGGAPTEYRIFCLGSTDYAKIQFIPAN